MDYIIGIVLVLAVIIALSALALKRRPSGRGGLLGPSITPSIPAADEPTPDRSITSSPDRIEAAKRKVPPA